MNNLLTDRQTGDKSFWRKEGLKNRRNLSVEIRQSKSKIILEYLTDTLFFFEAKTVFCYLNMTDEVQTMDVIKRGIDLGKIVSVPKIIGQGLMSAVQVSSITDLVQGEYGIFTVKDEACKQIPPKDIDLIIVPGVAFALNGSRIGMGGGYYDRFFRDAKHAKKIGVCYFCQLFDKIPTEDHDVSMDIIITEHGIIKIKGDTKR